MRPRRPLVFCLEIRYVGWEGGGRAGPRFAKFLGGNAKSFFSVSGSGGGYSPLWERGYDGADEEGGHLLPGNRLVGAVVEGGGGGGRRLSKACSRPSSGPGVIRRRHPNRRLLRPRSDGRRRARETVAGRGKRAPGFYRRLPGNRWSRPCGGDLRSRSGLDPCSGCARGAPLVFRWEMRYVGWEGGGRAGPRFAKFLGGNAKSFFSGLGGGGGYSPVFVGARLMARTKKEAIWALVTGLSGQ